MILLTWSMRPRYSNFQMVLTSVMIWSSEGQGLTCQSPFLLRSRMRIQTIPSMDIHTQLGSHREDAGSNEDSVLFQKRRGRPTSTQPLTISGPSVIPDSLFCLIMTSSGILNGNNASMTSTVTRSRFVSPKDSTSELYPESRLRHLPLSGSGI